MKYDFTSLMNRSGHDSIAVDQIPIPGAEVKEGFSRIPMWVADMNFPSLPTIQEAIHARVNEPHFGYFNLPDAYFDSIIRWQKERNGVEDLPREAIGYENGVDLREVLQNGTAADLRDVMAQAILKKPMEHCFERPKDMTEHHLMSGIGG